jgi:hypothetical protein
MTRDELLATRTASWNDEQRTALARVVDTLRPSPRHLADVLDWLEDIAARAGGHPSAVLAAPTLRAALASGGGASDRLKRWKEALRRLRYPRLAAREQEFAAVVRALDLGRGVAITPPPGFEGGGVTVTIRSGSLAELVSALDALERARRSGELARLFEIGESRE